MPAARTPAQTPKTKPKTKPKRRKTRSSGAERARRGSGSGEETRVEDGVVRRGGASTNGRAPAKARKGAKARDAAKGAKGSKPANAAKSARKKAKRPRKRAQAKAAKPKRRVFTAKGADRHELYQLSVQSPKEDVAFFARVYKTFRGRAPLHLREDFCGTAIICSTWIRRGADHTAEGFDIDPDPVGWGIEHNFAPLGDAAGRAKLHLKDVREPSERRPDVRVATNFSYYCLETRAELLEYFRAAYEDLADDGVFVLDVYGGPEAMQEMEEVRKIDEGFTYVWDQRLYHPGTGEYEARIHFRFRDGTKLERAFSYRWRLWFLTEIRDVLTDAGFRHVEQYWEGTAEDGESGNGIYRKSRRGENCEAWVTYLAALK